MARNDSKKNTHTNNDKHLFLLWELKKAKDDQEIECISHTVQQELSAIVSRTTDTNTDANDDTEDNQEATNISPEVKLGLRLAEKNMRTFLFKKFPLLYELFSVQLCTVSLVIIARDNDDKESTEKLPYIVPCVIYPPRVEVLDSPSESHVLYELSAWVDKNNFSYVMPIIRANEETYSF